MCVYSRIFVLLSAYIHIGRCIVRSDVHNGSRFQFALCTQEVSCHHRDADGTRGVARSSNGPCTVGGEEFASEIHTV